jgi:hypothetical protein
MHTCRHTHKHTLSHTQDVEEAVPRVLLTLQMEVEQIMKVRRNSGICMLITQHVHVSCKRVLTQFNLCYS